mgnify:CR=1 FL=1
MPYLILFFLLLSSLIAKDNFVYDPQDPNSETAMVLIINESESYFSINNDTLIVGQAHVDGPTSIFKRIE